LNAKPISSAVHIREEPAIQPPNWNKRRLFNLLWPLIVEQLLIVAMGLVDTVMVSYVGEYAVSGVSLVDMINFLLITTFTAIATGGAVVTSQYIGCRDKENTHESARQLIYISVLISVVTMFFTLLLCRKLLNVIYRNIDNDVFNAAYIYFLLTALSYPFLALYSAVSALFRSMGNSRITMIIALLANILNVAGNALFIYVMKLGVAGAALSTLIGRIIAASILLFLLIRDRSGIINIGDLIRIRINKLIIKRILNIGIPSGLESSMFQIGKILITRIFTMFGTAAIAANAVSSTINSLGFMPGTAFGIGVLVVVGQCLGAGDYAGAKKYTKEIIGYAWIFYLIINIFIFTFMRQIIGIFNLSPEAQELCASFLQIHCVTSTLFWCLSFVLPYALKAAGDARYVMIIAASTMWLIRVCSAFIMVFLLDLGPRAVWFAMGADFLFRGIFFTARWLSGSWTKKRVI
jgi:putative MATE family efflux protein